MTLLWTIELLTTGGIWITLCSEVSAKDAESAFSKLRAAFSANQLRINEWKKNNPLYK